MYIVLTEEEYRALQQNKALIEEEVQKRMAVEAGKLRAAIASVFDKERTYHGLPAVVYLADRVKEILHQYGG